MISDLSKIYEAYCKYTSRRMIFESNDALMDEASKPVSPEEAAALEKDCRDKFLATYLFLRRTHPFFAVFAMKCTFLYLPPGNKQGVNTMAVTYTGTTIMINTFFGSKVLTQEEFDGVIAHEVYHIMSQSLVRIGSRDNHKLWNIATDYIMNLELVRAGIALPTMGLVPELANPKDFTSDATADITFIIDVNKFKEYLNKAPNSAIKDYIKNHTKVVRVNMPVDVAISKGIIDAASAGQQGGTVSVDRVLVDITKMTQEHLYDVIYELNKASGKGGGGQPPPGPPGKDQEGGEDGDAPGPPGGPPRGPGKDKEGGDEPGPPGGPPRGPGKDKGQQPGKDKDKGQQPGKEPGGGSPGQEHRPGKALQPGAQPIDQHIQDEGTMTQQEAQEHAERIRRMVDEARKEAAQISSVKDPLLDEILGKYPPPPIDWKRLINAVAASPEYTTTQARAARSTYGTGAWVGRIVNVQDMPTVYFMIDSSGSMYSEIPSLVSAITDFIRKIPNASIRILFWDGEVSFDSGNIKYSSSSATAINKVFDAFKSAGTGGTVISCVRGYVDGKRIKIKPSDTVIYITDADVADPNDPQMITAGKKSVIITKTKDEMENQNATFIKSVKRLGYNVVAAKISRI
jgi:predicted metal-dependent peptidase